MLWDMLARHTPNKRMRVIIVEEGGREFEVAVKMFTRNMNESEIIDGIAEKWEAENNVRVISVSEI